jgi:hypothetical protein
MKMLKFISLILVIAFTTSAFGQIRPRITGSGKVVSEERKAGYFNAVKVSSGIDVYLTQGQKESITVEADDNLHEYIITEIKDNTLKVYSEANIRKAEAKKVHVTIKDVEKISASSAGDVYGETLIKADELSLSASSAGDIKLKIEVNRLECKINSSGDIKLEGIADELEADLSSAGDLKAYDLITRIADVSTSSAGDAWITVTEKLRARASSAGDIYYKGNPQQVDAHSSSAGGIHKK